MLEKERARGREVAVLPGREAASQGGVAEHVHGLHQVLGKAGAGAERRILLGKAELERAQRRDVDLARDADTGRTISLPAQRHEQRALHRPSCPRELRRDGARRGGVVEHDVSVAKMAEPALGQPDDGLGVELGGQRRIEDHRVQVVDGAQLVVEDDDSVRQGHRSPRASDPHRPVEGERGPEGIHAQIVDGVIDGGCSPSARDLTPRDRPQERCADAFASLKNMEYRALGRTGVQVSPLCLGAMMFGAWGNPDHEDSIKIIHRALDAGINFIDTADVYSRGESEEIVGKALAGGRRDSVVLATKVHGKMGDDPNEFGNSRRWITREVENSLRRLGTDWIDLYQIHRAEADTDIDETLGALTDLVRGGKVRYIGSSTFPASQIVEAQWVAERRGRERFVCEQPPYSILVRGVENDVLPTCRRHGMGVIPWSPLAGGWLSGRYRKDQDVPDSRRAQMIPSRYDLSLPGNQRKLEAADALARLAEEAGMTLIELALAFVIRHPAVTAAIIGPRTMAHLESQLTAADAVLSDEILDRIDAIVPPGVNINAADGGWPNPALEPAARRT